TEGGPSFAKKREGWGTQELRRERLSTDQWGRAPVDGAEGAEARGALVAPDDAPPPDQPREEAPLLPLFHPPDAAPQRGAAGGGIEARGTEAVDVRAGAVGIGMFARGCVGTLTARAVLLTGTAILAVAEPGAVAEPVAARPVMAALLVLTGELFELMNRRSRGS